MVEGDPGGADPVGRVWPQGCAGDALHALALHLIADPLVPALLELAQDVVYPHLTPVQRVAVCRQALALGQQAAAPLAGLDPLQVAQDLGVRVAVVDQPGPGLVRAEYAPVGTVTVYRGSLAAVAAALDGLQPGQWPMERVVALHVAHELFHHLEATALGPAHHRFAPVATFRLGRLWTTWSQPVRCREIAAHAFAQVLMGLSFLPGAADWLALALGGSRAAAEVERGVRRLVEETGVACVGGQLCSVGGGFPGVCGH